MDAKSALSSSNSLIQMHQDPFQAQLPREKSKRPQLSCNACRLRKVKCDRIQPCTACSLHQIADSCQYDLTEAERHPILQAEALREKDKEIARLRHEVLSLGGTSSSNDFPGGDQDVRKKRKSGLGLKSTKKSIPTRQKRSPKPDASNSAYFDSPVMANVIEDLSDLAIRSNKAGVPQSPIESNELYTLSLHPFPTLWNAKDGIPALIPLLPTREDISSYLGCFRHRAQATIFPFVPEECTDAEIERFLMDPYQNAQMRPDHLALIFAMLAHGLQHGVYDRCRKQWKGDVLEDQSKKADIFVAAAMHALRLGAFLSRPTLLAIETLVMIGPYLTNSGKLLDAWTLFGTTIRLAQAIGLHRDPRRLKPCPTPIEAEVRKSLWWWILHMDEQYSITFSRPLGISSVGEWSVQNEPHQAQWLSYYYSQISGIARQALSTDLLNNVQIDKLSEDVLDLLESLPDCARFNENWLNDHANTPHWPSNVQVVLIHQETHNFLTWLNRQRDDSDGFTVNMLNGYGNAPQSPQGRSIVIRSCREILRAFQFMMVRVRPALICWTICQHAFNAANILMLSMLEAQQTEDYRKNPDYRLILRAYDGFQEIQQIGIHRLAGIAVGKLLELINNLSNGNSHGDVVMSTQDFGVLDETNAASSSTSPMHLHGASQELKPERTNASKPENSKVKPSKKVKLASINISNSKTKVPSKKHRKDSVQRRSGSGLWTREEYPADYMGSFSAYSPTNQKKTSSQSSSTPKATHNTVSSSGRKDSSSSKITKRSNSSTHSIISPSAVSPDQISPKAWPFYSQAENASSFPPYTDYALTSYTQSYAIPTQSTSHTTNAPPSLHAHSYPSSTYANSNPSSLHTPSASHPVSPSLSQSQTYCLSRPQTQPQSPAWGFDTTHGLETNHTSMDPTTHTQQRAAALVYNADAYAGMTVTGLAEVEDDKNHNTATAGFWEMNGVGNGMAEFGEF